MLRAPLLALATLLTGQAALAQDTFDLLAVDSRAAALGGAMTATSEGFSSAYYNPGNLALCNGSSVSAQGSYMISDLSVEVPEGDAPATETPNRLGLTLGGCLRLPHRLALGLAVDTSADNLLGLSLSTPNATPRFFMYGAALQRPTIQAALAYSILDNLAIGVGVSATLNVGIELGAGVPVFEDGTVQVDIATRATPAVGAIVGLSYRPGPVKLGLTYRQAHYIQLDASAPIRLDEGSDVAIIDMRLATAYVPHQVALGVAVDPIESLTITADATWYHWRGYTGAEGGFGPYIQAAPGDGETLPDEANAADLLDYPTADLVFRDVFSPRLGVEYRFRDMLAFRGGYHYRPTPHPNPSGPTNLLDSDTHTVGLGVGYSQPLGKKGIRREDRTQHLRLDLHARVGMTGRTSLSQPREASHQNITWGGNNYDVGLTGTYAWK